jgi:hypothetical protein
MTTDYQIHKSQLIIDNQEQMIREIDQSYAYFKRNFGKLSSTWGYAFYNIFALTSPSPVFYQLFQELKTVIRNYMGHDRPLWIQSWANYHMSNEVLDWHDHNWPHHGYISIRPHKTKTVFKEYEVMNEVGNIYIGPGHRLHKVEVLEEFDTPRITLGYDILEDPGMPYEQFSLMPI